MPSKFSFRPSLESLDARIVPDATPVAPNNPDPLTNPIAVTQPAVPDAGTQSVAAPVAAAAAPPRRSIEAIQTDVDCIKQVIAGYQETLSEAVGARDALKAQLDLVTARIQDIAEQLKNPNLTPAEVVDLGARGAELSRISGELSTALQQKVTAVTNLTLDIIRTQDLLRELENELREAQNQPEPVELVRTDAPNGGTTVVPPTVLSPL